MADGRGGHGPDRWRCDRIRGRTRCSTARRAAAGAASCCWRRYSIGDELGSLRREMIGADQKCLLADRIPHQVIGVCGQHPVRTVEVVEGGRDIGSCELSPLARLERGRERREWGPGGGGGGR